MDAYGFSLDYGCKLKYHVNSVVKLGPLVSRPTSYWSDGKDFFHDVTPCKSASNYRVFISRKINRNDEESGIKNMADSQLDAEHAKVNYFEEIKA